MHFQKGHIYHLFNQGNNQEKIFYKRDHYIYFLRKIKLHVFPYTEILAWCLMPNHFHLMVYLPDDLLVENIDQQKSVKQNDIRESTDILPKSIGNMLSSYTRAINIQNNRSGSLFRSKTKALCLTEIDGITKSWYTNNGFTKINIQPAEKQYPTICYNYILNNPVKAKLVSRNEDWEFSSYLDVTDKRKGKLLSYSRITELGLVLDERFVD